MQSLFSGIERFGNRTAIIEKDTAISYLEVSEIADKATLEMKSRSLVIIIGSNDVHTVSFYIGCLRNDLIPILLPTNSTPQYANEIALRYKAKYVFCGQEKASWFSNYSLLQENTKYLVLVNKEIGAGEFNKELCLLIPTSGSTGNPKLVCLSKTNLEYNTKDIISGLDINSDHRAITTLPFCYSYGLSIINTHLTCGGSISLNELSVIQRGFWEKIATESITTFGGVPFTYRLLSKLDLSSLIQKSKLKYLTQAGGKLSSEEVLVWHEILLEHGVEFVVMYGQTEATARMAILRGKDIPNKKGSVGTAVRSGSFEIQNSESRNGKGEEGELIFRGKNVCMGYAQEYTDLKLPDNNHGFLKTGDFGWIDSEGYVYVTGRLDNVFKLRGIRMELSNLESQLNSVNINSALIGDSEKIHVFAEQSSQKIEIMKILTQSNHIRPIDIVFHYVDIIPRSESGKINYATLRAKINLSNIVDSHV